MVRHKKRRGRRTHYLSIAQAAAALNLIDIATGGLPSGPWNDAANAYGLMVQRVTGLDRSQSAEGMGNALAGMIGGGLISSLSHQFAPGAKLKLGRFGIKP